jgi:hypothetical protein
VKSVKSPEETGRGVLMGRRGRVVAADHQMLLCEARYSGPALTAAVMASTVRAIPSIKRGDSNLMELALRFVGYLHINDRN